MMHYNTSYNLLLLTTKLSKLKSNDLVIKLFIESINSIFLGHQFEWSQDFGVQTNNKIKVYTPLKTYGYVCFTDGKLLGEEEFLLLQNLAQMLALLLEKLEQESLLNDQKNHLNYLVEEKVLNILQNQSENEVQNEEIRIQNEEIRVQNEELIQLNIELRHINTELQSANEKLIKAKEEIEESEEKHRFLFENTIQGVVYHSANGEIIYANKAAERILGLSIEQLNGRTSADPCWKAIHEDGTDFPGDTHPVSITIKTGNPVTNIIMGIFSIKTNSIKWININSLPKFKNKILYQVVVTFEDITEIKNATEEIKRSKEKAEESDRLKTAFLHNMSHEIRTPMNAIIGFAELLPENIDDKEKLVYYSEIINQRGNDLLDILNDILDIAKIESGQLPVHIENCNLDILFKELKGFFIEHRDRMNKQNILFDIQANCSLYNITVFTDKVKLKQIFINLISNAFKFTDQGKIEGGCTLNGNQQLIFYVSDTGIGISPEKHQFIFERFSQIEKGNSRLYGGTGLGLSIVKGLIDLLGGKIWLHSEPGKGTTFYFTIS